jgi:hypothetical protein
LNHVTAPTGPTSNSDLLEYLRTAVDNRPRWRLHVHPEAAFWLAISVQNTGLSEDVRIVSDPACQEVGKGWLETLTVDQWLQLRALVGQQVTVTSVALGVSVGTLLALDHVEARIDLGGGDIRYLDWLTVEATEHDAAEQEGR